MRLRLACLGVGMATGCFPSIPEPADDTADNCGVSGSLRYVDAAATEPGDGSRSAPFQTLQEALTGLAPGVSVCLRTGTYTGEFHIGDAGTESDPIQIAGYPGEDVTLQESAKDAFGYVLSLSGSHIAIRNITVEGGGSDSGGSVLVYEANNVNLSRVRARYSRGTGFNVLDATNVVLEDCLSHDHVDPSDTKRGKGFAVRGTNVSVRRCVAHNNFNRGWDVYTGAVVENCAAFENGRALDNATGKVLVTTDDGQGFYSGDGGQIYRSLAFDNLSSGFRSFDGTSGAWDHCTALRNQFSYTLQTTPTEFKIRNNLLLEASFFLPDPSEMDQINNSWQLGIGDDVVLSKDPPAASELWPAVGSPWAVFETSDFLKPKPGSAVIDAGVELADRPFEFAGSAPDLGAWEASN
ncbi:MAG TPA: right-handed parallel beta-helix repeat-containing protein [Polyangiaceae bacterium]|nr:right-handed parallel beta-helix repeat-containing protein [Polyangiaceae bacterium]